LDFKHLYTLQGACRIKDIIQHAWANTLTGQLYQASFEFFFIDVGMGPRILDLPTNILFLATDSLVLASVHFLQEYQLHLHHGIVIQPQQMFDELIMCQLVSINLYPEELFKCNCCRIYLRALFLSDIITGDGLEISEDAWLGRREEELRSKSWPFCPKPAPSKWLIWQQSLRRALCARGHWLRTPLGYWVKEDCHWIRYCDENLSLCQYKNSCWFSHQIIARRPRLSIFQGVGQLCNRPKGALQRAGVYRSRSKLLFTESTPIIIPSKAPHDSLASWLQSSESPWCATDVTGVDQGEKVTQAIREGTAIAVSDGSYKAQ
jgi:hypothetical protein